MWGQVAASFALPPEHGRTLVGLVAGLILGAVVGFGMALVAMSVDGQIPQHQDGTYGMSEMLVCLPLGALVGTMPGAVSGERGRRTRTTRARLVPRRSRWTGS